jgi:hypothetical protein
MKFFEDIVIGSKFDAKGFKQAETALGRLSGSASRLAKGFGLAFGGVAVARFAKLSVKAFAEDEKASVRLLKAVDNLGMGFEQTRITQFIADLEKTAMVADDSLRPAFQSLLTTTGSVTKSQELLKLALDVSAGSTEDLATVSKDIANAYVGQTKGLKKYDLGLTAAELSTAGFAKIQDKLNQQFAGQNAARLDTYQGKLDTLNIAYGNMQETIGKGLLDSFEVLAGDAGIGGAASAMADFADFTSNAIYGLANLVSIKAPSGKTSLLGLLFAPIRDSLVAGPLGALSRLGARAQEQKNLAKPIAKTASGIPLTIAKSNADILREKLEKDAAKRAKALADMQLKTLKNSQDTLKLNKAKAVFDLQKIQIEAALKGKISEEDRIRLKLMQAIEEENISQIEKYTKLLNEAQQKTLELTNTLAGLNNIKLNDPFAAWTSSAGNTIEQINQLSRSMFTVQTQIQANGREWSSFTDQVVNTSIQPNLKEWSSVFSPSATNPTPAPVIPPPVTVIVQGTVTSSEDLKKTIQDAINDAGSSGRQTITGTPDRLVAI